MKTIKGQHFADEVLEKFVRNELSLARTGHIEEHLEYADCKPCTQRTEELCIDLSIERTTKEKLLKRDLRDVRRKIREEDNFD